MRRSKEVESAGTQFVRSPARLRVGSGGRFVGGGGVCSKSTARPSFDAFARLSEGWPAWGRSVGAGHRSSGPTSRVGQRVLERRCVTLRAPPLREKLDNGRGKTRLCGPPSPLLPLLPRRTMNPQVYRCRDIWCSSGSGRGASRGSSASKSLVRAWGRENHR